MPSTDDKGRQGDRPSWPMGGGAMGEHIGSHEWQSTSLGASETWQLSLRASVNHLLGASFPMLIMAGPELVQIYNDAYAELISDAAGNGLGMSAGEHPPSFLEADASVLTRALGGETVTWAKPTHLARGSDPKEDKWFDASFAPLRNDDGEVAGVILSAHEVTTYVLAERKLAGELQHRVRNSLSVVRSIARRTAENSETLEEFADHLEGRLTAFGRAQSAVVRYEAEDPDLTTLIVDELAAAIVQEGDQLTISGPSIRLQANAAEMLTLAFHELATNAVKFGAFAEEGGKVAISWSLGGEGDDLSLAIRWTEERPGAALTVPTHQGFGTELLERTLAYELEAETTLDYRPTGLLCTILLPAESNFSLAPAEQGL